MRKSRWLVLGFVFLVTLALAGVAVAQEGVAESASNLAATGGVSAVSWRYEFASSSGTYTEIVTGTVHGTSSNDDTSFNAIDLGFTFRYDGVDYTQVSIQSNGFIAMGPTVTSSYTPLSTGSSNNVIAAIGRDLQGNGTTSELRSYTEGSAPDRVFTVQWKAYKRYGSAYVGDDLNFQIKLYETSNVIEVVYGPFTTVYNAAPPTIQVGLRGASNADFNNRRTDASHDWSDSLAGTANTDAMTLTDLIYPPSGLTYTWDLFVGLLINPQAQSGNDCKGGYIDYAFEVANTTATTQTVSLVYSSTWSVDGPAVIAAIAPDSSELINVSVHVPWAAGLWDQDVMTMTASAGIYTDQATATSTSGFCGGYSDYTNLTAGRGARAPAVVYYDGKLYKIGGYGGASAAQAWVDIYDIATDTWSAGADMPGARYWIDCEAIAGKIYCAGGYLSSAQSTLYIYDIATNAWSTGAALPAARYHYASAQVGGKYYVIGGYTTAYQATMLAYDPATDTWDSSLASMSTMRRFFHAGAIGGQIYVAGGYTGSAYLNSAEVYNLGTNTWTPVAAMPTAWLNGADGVLHDRYLVLIGGASNSTSTASNYTLLYDALNDSWQQLPYFNHTIYGAEGDGDGDQFWTVSGRIYEGVWGYSHYTTLLDECTDCVPVTGADFTFDPAAPRPGASATFTGTVASGSPLVTYDWDFGDGAIGSGEVITHSYALTGTFTVLMTATNCDGASWITATHTITVASGPVINVSPLGLSTDQCPDSASSQPISVCNVGDEDLEWNTIEAISWLSAVPVSGTLSAGNCATVDITFDSTGIAAGTYTDTLQIASNDTENPFVDVLVELNVAGAATGVDFTWDPFSPNLNEDVTFTGQATAIVPVDFTWDFGDGDIGAGQVVTNAYGTAGVYTATMTAAVCAYTPEVVTHTLEVKACQSLVTEHFEGAFPPVDWSVTDNFGGSCTWQRNDFWATPRPNYAGGLGFAADADSDKCGSGTTMDTELRTMVIDLSTVTTATLSYMTSYNDIAAGGDFADTDVSLDGGLTWSNLLQWDADHSPNGPGELVELDLTPYAGNSNVMLRFHYYLATYDWWWEVDQVEVFGCYIADAQPDIAVAPVELEQVLTPGLSADQPLNIANEGLQALDWGIDEGCGTPVDWLSQEPISGTLTPGNDSDVIVTFDSAGLGLGAYYTSLCIYSNDPDEPMVAVTVTMIITGAPSIAVDPTSLASTQAPDTQVTQPLELCNVGQELLTWSLQEKPVAIQRTSLIPAGPSPAPLRPVITSPEQCAAYENYTGSEPVGIAGLCHPEAKPVEVNPAAPAAPTDIGFAQDIGYISDNFVTFTLDNFSGQTVVGTNINAYYGMDFDPTATILYALNDTTDELGTIDLTTGAFTPLVPCVPSGGETNWTGLTIDPVSGVFYGSTGTNLYIIDPDTGNVTLIGPFGTTLMIDIAMAMNGEMYGHDIGTDTIYQIDPSTGAATSIGLTGYAANYAQGMDFDNQDGTLYIFLYQGSGANIFGTVNLSTGAVTPLATSSPLGEFEGAIQTPGMTDVPWLSETPITGTIEAGACATVDVTFDSTGMAEGDTFAELTIDSDDPANPSVTIPVTLTVEIPSVVDFTYTDLEDVVAAGERIWIIGDFTGWLADPITMTANGDSSVFTATADIPDGSYGYKFYMPDLPNWANYDMLNTGNRTLDVSGDMVVDAHRNVSIGWSHLGDPIAVTITLGSSSGDLIGEVYISNVTAPAGEGRGVAAQLGYGVAADPATWTWIPMSYIGDNGNNDLFAGLITPVATGVYTYGVRFDGNWAAGNPNAGWTYGDRTGVLTVVESAYTLTVNLVGDGTVAVEPDQAVYDPGTSVTLTANANPGWIFAGWSGDLTGSDNPETLVMDANKVVTATFEAIILPEADLSVSKTASAEAVMIGGSLTYTLTVENLGPDDATDVVLTDTLPEGVTVVDLPADCTETDGVVVCDLGDIVNGDSATVVIVITAPGMAGTIINTAEVAGTETDPNVDNNIATVEVDVYGSKLYLPILLKLFP